MAGRVIPFIPRAHGDPSQLLRTTRERCGLTPREFAPLLGRAIGRPDLTAGALRAWEDGAVRPPRAILEAAADIARSAPPSRPSTNGEPPRAELPSLDDIRAGLRTLDGAYGRAPSTSLLPAASQHLGQIAAIRNARLTSSVRRDLDLCETDTAMLMGQLVWDASQRRDHATARMYFDQAIAAAKRIGDPAATAHGLLRNGYIALYGENDPLAGLMLAQAASEAAAGSSHTLAGLGLLHAAEAHAMLGRRSDCERALAAADTKLGSISHTDIAAHLFTEPEFDRLAGACYLSLGKHPQAAALLADTAARLHDRQKSRAIVLGNLALAHVRQGEVDAAAGALHQAIDLAAQTRGAGGLNLIFKATRELAPWRQEPVVQYVHDRVHDLMTAP
jgi:tetratricopeptide (TPR) repeat protein